MLKPNLNYWGRRERDRVEAINSDTESNRAIRAETDAEVKWVRQWREPFEIATRRDQLNRQRVLFMVRDSDTKETIVRGHATAQGTEFDREFTLSKAMRERLAWRCIATVEGRA